MAGIIIFLAITVDDLLGLIDRFYMMCKGEELTTLLGIVALARVFYRFIFVVHSNELLKPY